jgi:hypothetical protein
MNPWSEHQNGGVMRKYINGSRELTEVIRKCRVAMEGDSNDAEHDALAELLDILVIENDLDIEESECQNCGTIWPGYALKDVEDIGQRVAPGEEMPSGECPQCGAVCHIVKDASDN